VAAILNHPFCRTPLATESGELLDTPVMTGFGNQFSTEAVPGALPVGRNSPQKTPYGLYAELISGSPFTAPRSENYRSWCYRLRPSANHPAFAPLTDAPLLRSAPFNEALASPNRQRWDPLPVPKQPTDFIDGLVTYGGNGDVASGTGIGIHVYAANRSMTRVFMNADGEMLVVPQDGSLLLHTEMGKLCVSPLQIAVIPRGVRFRVELPLGQVRGYICENYGRQFRLPELGPIGSNGLANARDFEAPVAAFEDRDEPTELVQKYQGRLWTTRVDHSPLDVVAWHGNLTPYRYDLRRFNTVGTVSFDHTDPSVYTVLTSPSEVPGTANCDFVIFPPRWLVAEQTFRPPWYHRNVMSEFMGLILGQYDSKAEGFVPGGASLHNQMNAHGPDNSTYEQAISAELNPRRLDETMAFMFESRHPIRITEWANTTPQRQNDYDECWSGFIKARINQ